MPSCVCSAASANPSDLACDVRELIIAPRREHSRKPDEQYERIERFCAGPYVELSARQQWPGWFPGVIRRTDLPRPTTSKTDIRESVAEGFRAIRERVAAGGPGMGIHMSECRDRIFVLRLRSLQPDDGATIRAVRQLLKRILRQHQFRCLAVKEEYRDELEEGEEE